VVVRRDAFLSVRGFRERFGVGGEEELLAWDLAAAGWRLAYVPSVVAHHCPPGRADASARDAVQRRNAAWTAWLRRPLPVAVRGLRWLRPWVLRERRPGPPHVEAMRRRLEA
jgi:N-acetylglucosaminyl-diphospho-decaprenol L-rhamnosyltransferase